VTATKPLNSYLSRSPNDPRSLHSVPFLLAEALVYLRYPRLIYNFHRRLGYWPRPLLPSRYHEKILWRKLFDHDPRFVTYSDKIAAKRRISARFPDIRVARILWEGADPSGLPETVLSGNRVLKANHGSNFNHFVFGSAPATGEIRQALNDWLLRTYGRKHHEWGYWNIPRKLFVEEMLTDRGKPSGTTYKMYVAGGEVHFAYAKVEGEATNPRHAVFDADGTSVEVLLDTDPELMSDPCQTPPEWDRLVDAARRIGRDFDHVRCDLMVSEGDVCFSELTFYPYAGYDWIDDLQLMTGLNAAWDLRKSWFLSTRQVGWRGLYARHLKRRMDRAYAAEPS